MENDYVSETPQKSRVIYLHNRFRNCLQENQFIIPSFLHYGSKPGYQDYGIIGTLVKHKLLDLWRSFFLKNSDIDEIESPIIMPHEILKASGHVDRFTDYVVYDHEGCCYRADHLLKDYLKANNKNDLANKIDTMTMQEMEDMINEYNLLCTKVKVTTKNLMFGINNNGYLRPELAQGIFINLKLCEQFTRKGLPRGIAQIGKSYRNEICPKTHTRLLEFTQAEIEYFVDPLQKSNSPYFEKIKDITIPLFPKSAQLTNGKIIFITVQLAIEQNMINSQTIAYFLVKIYQFAIKIGLDPTKIRFRQHLEHEMAHYANECWDLETYVNGDWLECVGCADRGSYDLKAHSHHSSLMMQRMLDKPFMSTCDRIEINNKKAGKVYKDSLPELNKYIREMTDDEIVKNIQILNDTGTLTINDIVIPKDFLIISKINVKVTHEEFYPHVIEPSFGIDRLLYSVFEHNFWIRADDDKRLVMSLPKILAPYDVAIFALHKKEHLMNYMNKVKEILIMNDFHCFTDDSGVAIGKKYCRLDEIGVKYAITIDPGSLERDIVTVRHRDTMEQDEVKINDLVNYLRNAE